MITRVLAGLLALGGIVVVVTRFANGDFKGAAAMLVAIAAFALYAIGGQRLLERCFPFFRPKAESEQQPTTSLPGAKRQDAQRAQNEPSADA